MGGMHERACARAHVKSWQGWMLDGRKNGQGSPSKSGWIQLGKYPTHNLVFLRFDADPSVGHWLGLPGPTVTPVLASFCSAAMAQHTRAYRQMLGEWAFRLHQRTTGIHLINNLRRRRRSTLVQS